MTRFLDHIKQKAILYSLTLNIAIFCFVLLGRLYGVGARDQSINDRISDNIRRIERLEVQTAEINLKLDDISKELRQTSGKLDVLLYFYKK